MIGKIFWVLICAFIGKHTPDVKEFKQMLKCRTCQQIFYNIPGEVWRLRD